MSDMKKDDKLFEKAVEAITDFNDALNESNNTLIRMGIHLGVLSEKLKGNNNDNE